jgi:S1-C subfamily serine protease
MGVLKEGAIDWLIVAVGNLQHAGAAWLNALTLDYRSYQRGDAMTKRMITHLCLALGFYAAVFPGKLVGQPSKEPTYVQIERNTVRLEMKVGGKYIPQGTGFFVKDDKESLFIVTARHVVVGAGVLRARVPSLVTATNKTEMIFLELPPKLWTLGDDNDPATAPNDVAVMKLSGIKERTIVALEYCPTKCTDGGYNQLADDPHPMDQILILGFPVDLGFALKEQRPLVRSGVVSFAADEPFITVDRASKPLRKNTFIIDSHIFPGNSGGPVLVTIPFQPVRLGGLITGVSTQLTIGLVTPTSAIRQVLDVAEDAPMNTQAWFLVDPDR